jgi:P27 family predicted phage terminase small subunit
MPGRPPKPTALKLLHGNPGKRPLNDREPAPPIGRPKRPAWLAKDARRYWRQACETMERMGVLTVADQTAVGLLCNALAEYVEASREVEARGLLVEDRRYDKEGNIVGETVKANPAVAARADAWRRVNLMLQQFGMTASSRAKVKTEKPAEVDPFAEWERAQ